MDASNGRFVISLDLELLWGVRDVSSIETYGDHLRGVHTVIPKLLALFRKHHIKATFATVGLLFFSTKKELLDNLPEKKPAYSRPDLSPYTTELELLGESSETDPYHFAPNLVELIKAHPEQEIGTHTFSHYYCLEDGQTIEDFHEDLRSALRVAAEKNISIKSIVFPRNQFNNDYLKICEQCGITCVRGNEVSWIYEARSHKEEKIIHRLSRLSDAYLNISGRHCYTDEYMAADYPYNIPSSRFLRPYDKRVKWLEWLRLQRVKNCMTYAARKNLTYHIWWHPHNFGTNQDKNLAFLEKILLHYEYLNRRYNFTTYTMAEVAEQLDTKYGR